MSSSVSSSDARAALSFVILSAFSGRDGDWQNKIQHKKQRGLSWHFPKIRNSKVGVSFNYEPVGDAKLDKFWNAQQLHLAKPTSCHSRNKPWGRHRLSTPNVASHSCSSHWDCRPYESEDRSIGVVSEGGHVSPERSWSEASSLSWLCWVRRRWKQAKDELRAAPAREEKG